MSYAPTLIKDANSPLSAGKTNLLRGKDMPIQINYIQDGIGIEFILSGVVTGEEIVAANKDIYNYENLCRLKYKFIERSMCTEYSVTSEEVKIIAAQDKKASEINRNITIVFVSPTDLQYGMSRVWQAYTTETGFQSKIFKDRKSAEKWIKGKFK
jgi:hypothetical protein